MDLSCIHLSTAALLGVDPVEDLSPKNYSCQQIFSLSVEVVELLPLEDLYQQKISQPQTPAVDLLAGDQWTFLFLRRANFFFLLVADPSGGSLSRILLNCLSRLGFLEMPLIDTQGILVSGHLARGVR